MCGMPYPGRNIAEAGFAVHLQPTVTDVETPEEFLGFLFGSLYCTIFSSFSSSLRWSPVRIGACDT